MTGQGGGLGNPRWLISFADLLMLLLAFFVMLGATRADPRKVGDGMRAAFGGPPAAAAKGTPTAITFDPQRLFESDDAVLRAGTAARLAALGRSFAGRVTLVSIGEGSASGRLDRFELAAARTAALARALGIAPARITIEMRPAPGSSQRITLAAAR